MDNVCMVNEVPEALHASFSQWVENHPQWDSDRAITAALSLFLLQNGSATEVEKRAYMDSMFKVGVPDAA